MLDGKGIYDAHSYDEIEMEVERHRKGALIVVCILLLASYLVGYL